MSCPGNRPYRCDTCRWWMSGACMSQSSSHSCSWPALPIRSGARLARSRVHCCCRSAIDVEGPRRLDGVAEQLAQDLPIHRRPDRQRCAERMWVLGRQRRRGDEPAVRRLLDECVEEKLRRTLEQWIDALQIAAIAGVGIAIPQRQRQPRAAGRPHPPLRSVDRRGGAPQIRVVMRDPSARAVHLARRSRAGDR